MHIPELDEIDNKLLDLLYENARYTYSELAVHVGLSRIAVKNRISDLEESGFIKGYRAVTGPGKAGHSVRFVINVSPRPEHYDYVLGILGKSDILTQVYGTTGEGKILAFGNASSMNEMDAYYQKLRRIFTDVRYFSFDVIASTYKDIDGGIEYDTKALTASDAGGTDH